MMAHQALLAAALAAAVMISASCASPQVTRRYASAEFPARETSSDEVALSLFAMEVPVASAQTTVLSLSERAQAALIKELSAKVKDAPSLLNVLASPITKPKPPQRLLDRTVVERRVVMSIDNRSFLPSTRIHRAAIVLSLDTSGEATTPADFKSWSQFATKYQTVNLGSVRFTQANEFAIGVTAAPPQIPAVGVTGSATATRSLEESLNLQQRLVETTGVLTAKEARLVQEGAFGIDLTGNMVVDMTVSVGHPAHHSTTDIFTFTRSSGDSGKIEVDRQRLLYVSPEACRPVTATAELKATLRRVQDGDQTLIEGDDKAVYQSVTVTLKPQHKERDFELVPVEALRVSVWVLADPRNWRLHIRKDTGEPGEPLEEVLQFGSFDEANDFLDYLRDLPGDSPLAVRGRTLLLRSNPLLKTDLRGLQAVQQRLNWDKAHKKVGSRCVSP